MAVLASAQYDPAVAVSKSTTALLAMTAIDTTNLRLTFNAPANGIVFCRLRGAVHGATTFPRIQLGILEASTVVMRMNPMGQHSGTPLATTQLSQEVNGVITGLTAGSAHTYDAAYGVEIVLAATGLKYGGPNDATGNDAFGAFVFEIWEALNLLAGKLYDPAAAATIVTTGLRAMGAMDTTNLRLTFNAPPSGRVLWRVRTQFHGSATFGQVLLGVMEGAAIVGRVAPIMGNPTTPLATSALALEASGIISGLTPGSSHTYDAASAVQVVAAAGGLKHGGPNNTTTDDAFGGTAFEIWAA